MSTITGTIEKIYQEQVISDSFKKKEFVIKTEGDYPQFRKLEFTKDNTSKLQGFNVGDAVTVSFNLNGRAWENPEGETKYFNTDVAWQISKVIKSENSGRPEEQQVSSEELEDLPF